MGLQALCVCAMASDSDRGDGNGGGKKQSNQSEFDINLAISSLLHFPHIFHSTLVLHAARNLLSNGRLWLNHWFVCSIQKHILCDPDTELFAVVVASLYFETYTAVRLFFSLSLFLSLVHRRFSIELHIHIEFYGATGAKWSPCVWPFLLLLLVFISFLIARLWFHYSFHRSAHYFSLIQLVRLSVSECAIHTATRPVSSLHQQQRAYARIIKNAFNVLYGVCSAVHTLYNIHHIVITNDSIVVHYFCMFDCNKRCDNNNKISKHTHINHHLTVIWPVRCDAYVCMRSNCFEPFIIR